MRTEQEKLRRDEMFHALRVAGLLFLGFIVVTEQVLTRGWIYRIDHNIEGVKTSNFPRYVQPHFACHG